MNSIQNHHDHVKPLNYTFEPVQKSTPKGLPFTCRKESLQWQIEVKKCSCHSSWCELCWKRYGKKGLVVNQCLDQWVKPQRECIEDLSQSVTRCIQSILSVRHKTSL